MSLARFWSSLKLLHFSKPAADRPLYQAVRGRVIQSVLELRIGTGERSERLIGWLREQGSEGTIRYAAVDPFEAGGAGHLGLKEFHSRLGRLGARPLPVPLAGSLAMALTRVAHTIGAVDLLVLDGSEAELNDPAVLHVLSRLVREDSLVLTRNEASGALEVQPAARFAEAGDPQRRAAA
ncbi:hypothetical protein [Candidatus Laterigemmans baculatus]|uniref:hypothetical protein n=1 Tax=Candidatus Laterigemmans baculatus TaxID=2770505 RepID=UPI0013DA8C7F|nr:hypothetical protein [Candidatus Laterigemmans baculatus]